MARNKKEDKKDEVKEVKSISKAEQAKKARAARMARAGVSQKQVEENSKEEFRKYFIQLKRKLNLKSDLENVIWLHFKAAGFDKKDKFDEGIKHFGLKL